MPQPVDREVTLIALASKPRARRDATALASGLATRNHAPPPAPLLPVRCERFVGAAAPNFCATLRSQSSLRSPSSRPASAPPPPHPPHPALPLLALPPIARCYHRRHRWTRWVGALLPPSTPPLTPYHVTLPSATHSAARNLPDHHHGHRSHPHPPFAPPGRSARCFYHPPLPAWPHTVRTVRRRRCYTTHYHQRHLPIATAVTAHH